MKKLKLTMTLEVAYDLDGAEPSELRDRLRQVARDAYANGVITDDLGASINSWSCNVQDADDPDYGTDVNDPRTIIAWLRGLPEGASVHIDDDGLRIVQTGAEKLHWLEIGGHTPAAEEEIDFDQWDDDLYDVEGMRIDRRNGNFNPEDAERYLHANQVRESFINGQFEQAREMCESYGFNYELERYKFDGHED